MGQSKQAANNEKVHHFGLAMKTHNDAARKVALAALAKAVFNDEKEASRFYSVANFQKSKVAILEILIKLALFSSLKTVFVKAAKATFLTASLWVFIVNWQYWFGISASSLHLWRWPIINFHFMTFSLPHPPSPSPSSSSWLPCLPLQLACHSKLSIIQLQWSG